MCGIDDKDSVFRDQDEDWFGEKEREKEIEYRNRNQLSHIKEKNERDEFDLEQNVQKWEQDCGVDNEEGIK